MRLATQYLRLLLLASTSHWSVPRKDLINAALSQILLAPTSDSWKKGNDALNCRKEAQDHSSSSYIEYRQATGRRVCPHRSPDSLFAAFIHLS